MKDMETIALIVRRNETVDGPGRLGYDCGSPRPLDMNKHRCSDDNTIPAKPPLMITMIMF